MRSHDRDRSSQLLPRFFAVGLALLTCGLATGASADDAAGDDAREGPRYYVTGLVGGAWVGADIEGSTTPDGDFSGTSNDGSPFGGAAAGTILDLGWSDLRLELEGTGGRNFGVSVPVGGGAYAIDAKLWTFQGDFWFEYSLDRLFPDTPIVRRLAAFGGGGLGLSRVTLDAVGPGGAGSDQSTEFAWQAGGGLAYEVSRWLVLEARYQYADLGKPSVEIRQGGTRQGSIDVDLGTNEVVGGIRFVLP